MTTPRAGSSPGANPVVEVISPRDRRPGLTGPAGPPTPPMTDAELLARISMITDQVLTARGEVALGRAAYERACEEESALRPWPLPAMQQAAAPRVAHALRARIAAVQRFGVWARELDWLHREARARGLLSFPGQDPAGNTRPARRS